VPSSSDGSQDQIEIDDVGHSLFEKSKHDKGARQEESGGPLILESGRPVTVGSERERGRTNIVGGANPRQPTSPHGWIRRPSFKL